MTSSAVWDLGLTRSPAITMRRSSTQISLRSKQTQRRYTLIGVTSRACLRTAPGTNRWRRVITDTSGPANDKPDGEKESSPDTDDASTGKTLPAIIPPEAVEALRVVGIDTPEKTAAVLAISASVSRSPFPSPDMLHAYDEYKAGMGMEVVEWLKDQTRHRQGLERNRADGSERRLNRSQIFAFVIGMAGLLIAAIASYWSAIVAAVIAIVAVGGPSAASILARLIDPRGGRPPTQPPG